MIYIYTAATQPLDMLQIPINVYLSFTFYALCPYFLFFMLITLHNMFFPHPSPSVPSPSPADRSGSANHLHFHTHPLPSVGPRTTRRGMPGCRGLSATTTQPSATNTEMKLLSAQLGPGSRWPLVQVRGGSKQSLVSDMFQRQREEGKVLQCGKGGTKL